MADKEPLEEIPYQAHDYEIPSRPGYIYLNAGHAYPLINTKDKRDHLLRYVMETGVGIDRDETLYIDVAELAKLALQSDADLWHICDRVLVGQIRSNFPSAQCTAIANKVGSNKAGDLVAEFKQRVEFDSRQFVAATQFLKLIEASDRFQQHEARLKHYEARRAELAMIADQLSEEEQARILESIESEKPPTKFMELLHDFDLLRQWVEQRECLFLPENKLWETIAQSVESRNGALITDLLARLGIVPVEHFRPKLLDDPPSSPRD